jgi:hypothetical protein
MPRSTHPSQAHISRRGRVPRAAWCGREASLCTVLRQKARRLWTWKRGMSRIGNGCGYGDGLDECLASLLVVPGDLA